MFWIGSRIRCKYSAISDTLKATSRANILTRPPHPSGSFTITSLVHLFPSSLLTRFCNASLLVPFRFGARWAEVDPPYLVMPLTVEASKPRLCNDNRFLNLWLDDRPFSLDHLHQLSLYVSKDAYQTVCDDKSGYDHILLATISRTYLADLFTS